MNSLKFTATLMQFRSYGELQSNLENEESQAKSDLKHFEPAQITAQHDTLLRRINYLFHSLEDIKDGKRFKYSYSVPRLDVYENSDHMQMLQTDTVLLLQMFQFILDYYYRDRNSAYREHRKYVGVLFDFLLKNDKKSWEEKHNQIIATYELLSKDETVTPILEASQHSYHSIELGFSQEFLNRRGAFASIFNDKPAKKFHSDFIKLIHTLQATIYNHCAVIDDINEAEQDFLAYLYYEFTVPEDAADISTNLDHIDKPVNNNDLKNEAEIINYENKAISDQKRKTANIMSQDLWEQIEESKRQALWELIQKMIDVIPIQKTASENKNKKSEENTAKEEISISSNPVSQSSDNGDSNRTNTADDGKETITISDNSTPQVSDNKDSNTANTVADQKDEPLIDNKPKLTEYITLCSEKEMYDMLNAIENALEAPYQYNLFKIKSDTLLQKESPSTPSNTSTTINMNPLITHYLQVGNEKELRRELQRVQFIHQIGNEYQSLTITPFSQQTDKTLEVIHDYSRLNKYIRVNTEDELRGILYSVRTKLLYPHIYRITNKLTELSNFYKYNPCVKDVVSIEYAQKIEEKLDNLIKENYELHKDAFGEAMFLTQIKQAD